jgi:hypothetical protein
MEYIEKNCGYLRCNLNQKKYYKHRLVATQFLTNPDNLPEVDHINHNRTDNRIDNLRWCSHSDNMFNLQSHGIFQYEYFDDLPVPCQPFVFYNGHDFEGYMIDNDKNIYFHNSLMFRKLQLLIMKNRYPFYCMTDIEGKQVCVFLNKLD